MPTELKIISLHLLYAEVLFSNAVYICGHAIHGGVIHEWQKNASLKLIPRMYRL
jgi:hypothetical protein